MIEDRVAKEQARRKAEQELEELKAAIKVSLLRLSTHGISKPKLINNFTVLKKCRSKFDCLINEMLIIQDLKTTLNVQSDSIRAKLFT